MLQVIKEKYNAPTFADLNLGDIKMGSYQNFQPKVGPLKIGISDVTVEPYLEDGIRLSTHNQITQGERSYLIPKLDNLKYEVALPLSRKKSVTHDLEDFDGKKDLLKLMNDTVTALKPYATNAQKAT